MTITLGREALQASWRAIVFALIFALPSFAQDAEPSANVPLTADSMQLLELAGLDTKAIIKMFGEPDRRSSSNDAENWHYGSSTVFFSGGKVAAWTGAEYLSGIVQKQQFTMSTSLSEEEYEKGIVSDWRPEANISSDEIIREIVGEASLAATKDPSEEFVPADSP